MKNLLFNYNKLKYMIKALSIQCDMLVSYFCLKKKLKQYDSLIYKPLQAYYNLMKFFNFHFAI